MATITFNLPAEFLVELEQGQQLVRRGIVRIPRLYRTSSFSPVIRHLSVVATALIGGDVVRCESDCGDLWQMADHDTATLTKAGQVCRALEDGCARLGLQVRAGIAEEKREQ
jgi:hypothetical protein